MSYLEKGTAFVLRAGSTGPQLLIFRHPTAGFQLPAGTVEAGERPDRAVMRAVAEEAGLEARLIRELGVEERPAPAG
jgi:ADP-ribose pyrophosphatase YjhB (NUDIX family)